MTTAAARRRYRELGAADAARSLANIRERIASTISVESRSRPGHFHEVRVALDGALICPCPAGMNQLHCWHQDEARRQMATQAVAIRPIELKREILLHSDKEIERVNVAAKLFMSGAVTLPEGIKNQAQVAALMLYGLELGLAPMTAMRHLYIVNGKVNPSSEVMAGMLMKADPKAKLIVERLEVEGGDNNAVKSGICTMRIIRPGRDIDQRWTVTWDQIKRAGLARGNNLQYPEDRLRYHCTKRLLRTYAPDLINAFGDDAPTLEGLQAQYGIEGAPAELVETNDDALYNEGDDEPTEGSFYEVESDTGEITKAPPITDEQRKRIAKLWNPKHFRIADLRQQYASAFPEPGMGVNDTKDLTAAQADEVIAILSETEPAAADPACEHEARMDEEKSILVCGKCGAALEGPDAVQTPGLPI